MRFVIKAWAVCFRVAVTLYQIDVDGHNDEYEVKRLAQNLDNLRKLSAFDLWEVVLSDPAPFSEGPHPCSCSNPKSSK